MCDTEPLDYWSIPYTGVHVFSIPSSSNSDCFINDYGEGGGEGGNPHDCYEIIAISSVIKNYTDSAVPLTPRSQGHFFFSSS